MRVYFLSARPCALSVDGAFRGYTDGFARTLELSPREEPLCEFLPADGERLPLRFVLRDGLHRTPPRGVKVCLLPDGVALYADGFLYADAALRPVAGASLPFGGLTVYAQAGVHYLFEGESGTKTGDLSERFAACRIRPFANFALIEGEGAVCALDKTGTPFFCGRAEDWSADEEKDELRVTAPLGDLCGRTAAYTFDCAGEMPVLRKRRLSPFPPLPADGRFALCRLLETLRGEEEEEGRALLSADLGNSLPALRDYFGDFSAAVPLPFAPFAAGTVCPQRENVYVLKGYAATMREGKIENVRRTF